MKKRIIILGSVVLLVVIAWSAAWLVLATMARQGIEAQALADGVTSPRVSCGTLDIDGFPFRFDASCADTTIVSGDSTITLPGISASVRVYAPTHMVLAAQGPAEIVDSFTGLRNAVAWSALDGSARLDNWRIARVSLEGRDVAWSDTLLGDVLIAQAPLVGLHLLDIPEQHDAERRLAALAGYMVVEDLAMPGLTLAGTDAELEVELTGLPDDVRNWGDPDLLRTMASQGSTLKLVSIRGTDGQSSLNADGALSLNGAGLLDGQINVTSTGVAERIGPLLEEPWRTLVLGTPGPDGAHVNQVNFRSGAIFSGLVPIGAVPPLF